MIKTRNKTIYKAFGFFVMSELLLQELPQLSNDEDMNIDIIITKEDLSQKWNEIASQSDASFYVEENLVMYKFLEVAIFSIQDGRRISVSPLNEYDEETAGLVILGTCMGAVLMQRNVLPLHGSAVAIKGKAYAIVGDSGAGKSTLALSFLNRGFSLLTDDVIAVSLKGNIPIVTPSYPQQKLWKDCLLNFGMETDHYKSLFGRENKYSVPVMNFSSTPLPLGGIIELVKVDDKEIVIRPIENLERFFKLFYHTYRNFFVEKLGLMSWHFDFCAKMMNKVNIYQFGRPITVSSSSQLVSEILNMIDEGA